MILSGSAMSKMAHYMQRTSVEKARLRWDAVMTGHPSGLSTKIALSSWYDFPNGLHDKQSPLSPRAFPS